MRILDQLREQSIERRIGFLEQRLKVEALNLGEMVSRAVELERQIIKLRTDMSSKTEKVI